jgi:hypothetical protein
MKNMEPVTKPSTRASTTAFKTTGHSENASPETTLANVRVLAELNAKLPDEKDSQLPKSRFESRRSTLNTFYDFPNLPVEIREMIFRYVIQNIESRIITLEECDSVMLKYALLWSQKLGKFQVDNENNDTCRFTTRLRIWGADVPALLHVNCEARNLALQSYKELQWADLGKPVFFDFTKDILHFPGNALNFFYRPKPLDHDSEHTWDQRGPWVKMPCKCPVDTNSAITDLELKVRHIIQTGTFNGGFSVGSRFKRFKALETLTLAGIGVTPDMYHQYRTVVRWAAKSEDLVIEFVPLRELDVRIKGHKFRDGRDGYSITGGNPSASSSNEGYAETKGYDRIPVCEDPDCSINAPEYGNYLRVDLYPEILPRQQHKHINFSTSLADDWVYLVE